MKKKMFTIVVTVLLFGSLIGLAKADQTIVLQGGPDMKKAHGEATIKDKGTDQKEITIHATDLKPNQVYTVWLVNMKPKMDMTGVGEGDYSFKSNDKGVGHFEGSVSFAELQKWQMLEIAHHPDGNPMNMKKMGIALMADLK